MLPGHTEEEQLRWLLFQLGGSNHWVEGLSYLFGTPTLPGGFPCHREPWLCDTR